MYSGFSRFLLPCAEIQVSAFVFLFLCLASPTFYYLLDGQSVTCSELEAHRETLPKPHLTVEFSFIPN